MKSLRKEKFRKSACAILFPMKLSSVVKEPVDAEEELPPLQFNAPPIVDEEQSIEVPDVSEEQPEAFEQEYHQEEQPEPTSERVPIMYPIGQMHGTYILAQNENGLYIIDQHAAQERIKYEYFREKVGEVEPEVQDMIVPLTFHYSTNEALIIEQHKQELESVGVF